MKSESYYRLTAACLIVHELESVLLRPDIVLKALRSPFEQVIMLAHVPVVLGMLVIAEFTRRLHIRFGLCMFAVLHVGLHWIYRDQPFHGLGSLASWVLILLAGIFGAAYLIPEEKPR